MEQAVFDTSEICYHHGVRYAVFSPGSRNAPLSISFNRNPRITTYTIIDERSAGFIALGIAQQTNSPVVLCCTSGSALLNYGPAIAEAYYQQIPLIIMSADRPPEMIDQWDGQTIRQQNPFSSHVKRFLQTPVNLAIESDQWGFRKVISDAAVFANSSPKGPVHINLPFREPFYPEKGEKLEFSQNNKSLRKIQVKKSLVLQDISEIQNTWRDKKYPIIVLGQQQLSQVEKDYLKKFSELTDTPILADVTSNGQSIEGAIKHHDLFLSNQEFWTDHSVDLVVYIGRSLISKNLKNFLRNCVTDVWHIGSNPNLSDPLKSLNEIIDLDIIDFLNVLLSDSQKTDSKLNSWNLWESKSSKQIPKVINEEYSELNAFQKVLDKIPIHSDIHLANSTTVRNANILGITGKSHQVFCNRGTSGIDGSNGTAVGHALACDKKTILLTGDLAFLYDPNAFIHEYDLSNLFVVVFNNFGGGIFDLIPGPISLPILEREKHFTTPHSYSMKGIADNYGFAYYKANDNITLELSLSAFFENGGKPKLLEIQTDQKINQKIYFGLKQKLNE